MTKKDIIKRIVIIISVAIVFSLLLWGVCEFFNRRYMQNIQEMESINTLRQECFDKIKNADYETQKERNEAMDDCYKQYPLDLGEYEHP